MLRIAEIGKRPQCGDGRCPLGVLIVMVVLVVAIVMVVGRLVVLMMSMLLLVIREDPIDAARMRR